MEMRELEKDAEVIARLRNGPRPGDTPQDRAHASADFGNRAQQRFEVLVIALRDAERELFMWRNGICPAEMAVTEPGYEPEADCKKCPDGDICEFRSRASKAAEAWVIFDGAGEVKGIYFERPTRDTLTDCVRGPFQLNYSKQ
jgi:hypothetical protein